MQKARFEAEPAGTIFLGVSVEVGQVGLGFSEEEQRGQFFFGVIIG